MSSESFKAFADKLQHDEALQKEVHTAGDQNGIALEKLTNIAAAHGYEFTVEDVSSELEDAQLEGVAGGLARTLGRMDIPSTLSTSQTYFKFQTYNVSGSTYLKIDLAP